jgi:hypothetical protein
VKERAVKYSKMALYTKVGSKTIKLLEEVDSSMQMVTFTRVSGLMIWLMDLVSIDTLTEQAMRAFGNTISSMEKARRCGQMVHPTKDITS